MSTPSLNHSTSQDYELLVHSLVQQELGGLSGVEVIELSRNVAMTGLSGYVHQIDVMYRIKIWLTEMLVLVECKQYAKRVGVDDLLEFKSRLEDLRAHKGIFVTSSDYQSGAVEFARANRIALLVVNATKKLAILYSLASVLIDEQCERQHEQLNKLYDAKTSGKADRISIDQRHHQIAVQHNGVGIQMTPWELQKSMLYKQSCTFSDVERDGIYFAGDRFTRLPTNKLLKSLVLDELLDSDRQIFD